MNIKPVVCALALTMGFSGVSFAQQDKDVRANQAGQDMAEQGRRIDERNRRANDRGRVAPPPQRQFDRGRDDARRGGPGPDRRGPGWDQRRGPQGNADWRHRGGHLPMEYRSRQYVVDDWRGHRLSAPPRGYHWVQTGGDYLLVAITTGIIASILLNQ